MSFSNMSHVVKRIQHGQVEFVANISKTKMHFALFKCTSWKNKIHFMLVIKPKFDFIIRRIKENISLPAHR